MKSARVQRKKEKQEERGGCLRREKEIWRGKLGGGTIGKRENSKMSWWKLSVLGGGKGKKGTQQKKE